MLHLSRLGIYEQINEKNKKSKKSLMSKLDKKNEQTNIFFVQCLKNRCLPKVWTKNQDCIWRASFSLGTQSRARTLLSPWCVSCCAYFCVSSGANSKASIFCRKKKISRFGNIFVTGTNLLKTLNMALFISIILSEFDCLSASFITLFNIEATWLSLIYI